jgi:hypothetical protein
MLMMQRIHYFVQQEQYTICRKHFIPHHTEKSRVSVGMAHSRLLVALQAQLSRAFRRGKPPGCENNAVYVEPIRRRNKERVSVSRKIPNAKQPPSFSARREQAMNVLITTFCMHPATLLRLNTF